MSMRVKFVGVMVVTALTVVIVALIAIPLALEIFRKVHTQPARVEERLESYVRDFAAYVAEENIRADDTVAVVKWTRHRSSVYLTVFNDGEQHFGAAGGELWEGGAQPDMEPFFDKVVEESGEGGGEASSNVYIVRFANGVHSVAVTDYSLATGTDTVIIGGVLTAVCFFFIILILYYHSQTRAIVDLSHKVEVISGGALDAGIETQRNDEIGQLAEDVDIMRHTILQRVEERERAWQANSDLLTSMTHDIRTPLTTLLGYMEILSTDNANLTEEQKDYVRVCTQKAEQIKGLSDELFLYFWAYNRLGTEHDTPTETYGAGILFEQIIGEAIPALEVKGLSIETDLSAISAADTVSIPIDRLRRVTDNIFDNITKYADPTVPVCVAARREGSTLEIRFTNAVGAPRAHISSTRIGVKTCVHIMELMGGRFETESDKTTFTASVILPITDSRG